MAYIFYNKNKLLISKVQGNLYSIMSDTVIKIKLISNFGKYFWKI